MGYTENEDYKEKDWHKDCKKEGECAKFFPDSIKDLLKKLSGECVTLVYKSGNKEKIKIECVSGDLLVAKEGGCLFRFIDIDCICGVIAECYDILDGILR